MWPSDSSPAPHARRSIPRASPLFRWHVTACDVRTYRVHVFLSVAMIAAACLRTLLATLVVSSAYAFAPLTRSHETSATPSCVACAFLADRIQQELPARVPA